jgi:DNA-binding NarL/FixJ family response regulator
VTRPIPLPPPLRCVVVEDQLMFLQLLVRMLREQKGLEVVGTAHGVAEGLQVCRRCRPELLILDLLLPDGAGLEVVNGLAAEEPLPRVIVLSGEAEGFHCPPHLRSLLHAVVDKTRAYDALRAEINLLWQQRCGGAEAGAAELSPEQGLQTLTVREREILSLIGLGLINREIAARLQVSPRTVETHRRNIIAKVGVSGPELVRYAALQG